jgi:hypothetical protein
MDRQDDRHQQQAAQAEQQREPLEAAKVAGRRGEHRHGRGDDDTPNLRQAQEIKPEADADELGHDGQAVQDEQVDDAERAPQAAEALQDQPRMTDARHRAQTQDHLLIDVEHRNEQHQGP